MKVQKEFSFNDRFIDTIPYEFIERFQLNYRDIDLLKDKIYVLNLELDRKVTDLSFYMFIDLESKKMFKITKEILSILNLDLLNKGFCDSIINKPDFSIFVIGNIEVFNSIVFDSIENFLSYFKINNLNQELANIIILNYFLKQDCNMFILEDSIFNSIKVVLAKKEKDDIENEKKLYEFNPTDFGFIKKDLIYERTIENSKTYTKLDPKSVFDSEKGTEIEKTEIEKIDSDILDTLKEYEKHDNDYKWLKKYPTTFYSKCRRNIEERNEMFMDFCKTFESDNESEINILMQEILECDDIEIIKDKTMIIYNIILSKKLAKTYYPELIEIEKNDLYNLNSKKKQFRITPFVFIGLMPFIYIFYISPIWFLYTIIFILISVTILLGTERK